MRKIVIFTALACIFSVGIFSTASAQNHESATIRSHSPLPLSPSEKKATLDNPSNQVAKQTVLTAISLNSDNLASIKIKVVELPDQTLRVHIGEEVLTIIKNETYNANSTDPRSRNHYQYYVKRDGDEYYFNY